MDLLSSRKTKLASFRIRELKDVLSALGLPKQGRKQDLVDRLQEMLLDETVGKVVDETYRKMQSLDDVDLTTNENSASVVSDGNVKMEVEDSLNSSSKICCPCGNSLPTEFMIQCVDPSCQVQQHIACVIVPENTMEESSSLPPYFCEMCRIKRADPFWVSVSHLVSPVKLVASQISTTDGTPSTVINVGTNFHLTKALKESLQSTEYGVQAWCILLNDKVRFRIQWPQYADFQVNGFPIRTNPRPGSLALGANGRDDGVLISLYLTEGTNKISLSGYDVRNFCFGVRLVKRRTVEQVLSMIPKETEGESFENALARVCRCIGGGMASENKDSDSDLEVITDSVKVDLRCPISGSRMTIAARFKPCMHMGCFDLRTFVELAQQSKKWQCPVCLKNFSLDDLIIDPFFNCITTAMKNCGEDMTEIVVKPNGSWTVKARGELGDLAQWHLPNHSLSVGKDDGNSNLMSWQIDKEDSPGHNYYNVGMKNNPSGILPVSEHQLITLSPRNNMEDNFGKIISMSSSATGRNRDSEDPSINVVNFGPDSFNQTGGTQSQTSLTRISDVIILSDSSDSEEENVNMLSTQNVYNSFPVMDNASEFSDSYLRNAALLASTSSGFEIFSGNSDDVGTSNWPYDCGTKADSGFQMFRTDQDVPDARIIMDHSPLTSSAPINGYTSKSASSSVVEVLDSSVCDTTLDMDEHEALIDNPMAFVHDDPALQNFLPVQPAVASTESNLGFHHPTSTGIHSSDRISPRLGSGSLPFQSDVRSHIQSAAADKTTSRNSRESIRALSDEHKSIGTNNGKLSNGPFSFPRQPRSARQRIHA